MHRVTLFFLRTYSYGIFRQARNDEWVLSRHKERLQVHRVTFFYALTTMRCLGKLEMTSDCIFVYSL